MGHAYNNIGNIYLEQNIPGKAGENYLKALKVYEDVGSKDGICFALSNLGEINLMVGKPEKSMEYSVKGLKIAEELKDKSKICAIIHTMALTYLKQKDFKKP